MHFVIANAPKHRSNWRTPSCFLLPAPSLLFTPAHSCPLTLGTYLWLQLATKGLLNIIAAPQLGQDSTYRALHTQNGRALVHDSSLVAGTAESVIDEDKARKITLPSIKQVKEGLGREGVQGRRGKARRKAAIARQGI